MSLPWPRGRSPIPGVCAATAISLLSTTITSTYTTYAGLGSIYVTTDQVLVAGDIVGAANKGLVKFELRKGRQSLNPAEWIRM